MNKSTIAHLSVAAFFALMIPFSVSYKHKKGAELVASASYFDTIPKVCISGNSNYWAARINQLSYIREKIKQSDLTSKESNLIIDSVLTPFMTDIFQQSVKQDSNFIKKYFR